MANNPYLISKLTDGQLLEALEKVTSAVSKEPGHERLAISLAENVPAIDGTFGEVVGNGEVKSIVEANSSIIQRAVLNFTGLSGALIITRQPHCDEVSVNFRREAVAASAAKLLSAVHKHLPVYARTESIDKLLGDELAEFYRKREAALMRLEGLGQQMQEQLLEHQRTLDENYRQRQDALQAEFETKENARQDEHAEKLAVLESREKAFDERVRNFDDRNNRHVRRELHQHLKKALAERNKTFALTKDTTGKRSVIHVLFWILLAFLAVIAARNIPFGTITNYWTLVPFAVSAGGFAATMVFYIRWCDHWFRQHADEEFRLKRLDLDIDRASWVVEMALEWTEAKGSEIPKELVDRLTANIFDNSDSTIKPTHPTEDLIALLSASSGLSLRLPGGSEFTFNRRGVKQLRDIVEESATVKS